MAPQAEVAVNLEHDNGDNGVSDKDVSMEESVLQHLENLTSQLTEETRICFRDSLYRLADNSKQGACQSRNSMADQDSTWFSKEQNRESRTNAIDRTVANFLFSNVEFGASEGSSLDFTEATNIRQHSGGAALAEELLSELQEVVKKTVPAVSLDFHTSYVSS